MPHFGNSVPIVRLEKCSPTPKLGPRPICFGPVSFQSSPPPRKITCCDSHYESKSTSIATISATGELRGTTVEVAAELNHEDEPKLPPAAAAGVLLAAALADLVPVAVAEAPAVMVDVTWPAGSTITFGVESLAVQRPWRLLNLEASVTAAGVEPQLLYCCMWIALFSRSKTAACYGQPGE